MAFKFSNSCSFGFDRQKKIQKFVENVLKSVRNYMDVIEYMLRYVKK